MIKKIVMFLAISIYVSNIFAQTSSKGEYEIYTREVYLNSIAYFTSSFELPSQFSGERLNQQGVAFTHTYEISNLGNIALSDVSELRFSLKGIFRIGLCMSESYSADDLYLYPNSTIRYYSGSLDVFSIFITPQFTHIIGDGTAMTLEIGFNLGNLGGDVSILEEGTLQKHSIGVLKLFPLAFRPVIFFDFGRSGLGLGAYINPMDIVNVIVISDGLYDNESSIQTLDSFYKRYEFQIVFTF